jgi:hypothetical protein
LADATATDNFALDKGEFAVIILDFGKDNRAVYTPSESNPALAVIGVPSSTAVGVEFLGVARAARLNGNPRNNFGVSIPGVTVTVFNYLNGSQVSVGPAPTRPHLELSVSGYSRIPGNLARNDPTNSVISWDPSVACIAMSANLGSIDDGPVGEDRVIEQQNCPSPNPSPSPSPSPSHGSLSPSPSSPTPSPSRTVAPSGRIVFTGDVVADFPPGPGVFIATDSQNDVFFPHPSALGVSASQWHPACCLLPSPLCSRVGGAALTIEGGGMTSVTRRPPPLVFVPMLLCCQCAVTRESLAGCHWQWRLKGPEVGAIGVHLQGPELMPLAP